LPNGRRGPTFNDVAYRLKQGEGVAHAVRRMARAELRDAARSITKASSSPTDRVHDLRTSLKKTRALLRLVRPTAGRPARRENRRLREVAAAAAAFRDADVVLTTFDALVATLPAATRRRFARVRLQLDAGLDAEKQRLFGDGKDKDLRSRLRRRAKHVHRWSLPGATWRAVGPGLVDDYRRARRAMAAAYRGGDPGAFHAWRRAVKTHRYQMQALERLAPSTVGARVAPLDRLGDLLGEEHDLTVLAEALQREGGCFSDTADRDLLLRALIRRQQSLRAAARPLGTRLLAERPSQFGRRVRAELRALR
jgi:CHAD domain-containing protein